MALVLSARNIRWRHRSRAWLTSCLALDTPHGACSMKVHHHTDTGQSQADDMDLIEVYETMRCKLTKVNNRTYHILIIVLTHGNGFLRRHHIPQTIAPQDDVAMFFGVKNHHTGVWLRRNHKLPAVKVIAPQVTW